MKLPSGYREKGKKQKTKIKQTMTGIANKNKEQ